jgi:hypothetical protein
MAGGTLVLYALNANAQKMRQYQNGEIGLTIKLNFQEKEAAQQKDFMLSALHQCIISGIMHPPTFKVLEDGSAIKIPNDIKYIMDLMREAGPAQAELAASDTNAFVDSCIDKIQRAHDNHREDRKLDTTRESFSASRESMAGGGAAGGGPAQRVPEELIDPRDKAIQSLQHYHANWSSAMDQISHHVPHHHHPIAEAGDGQSHTRQRRNTL